MADIRANEGNGDMSNLQERVEYTVLLRATTPTLLELLKLARPRILESENAFEIIHIRHLDITAGLSSVFIADLNEFEYST